VRPAINVGLSVSRVGGSAQIKAMRQIAGTLRLDLAQYRELAAFAQFGSDLDKSSQAQLNRGRRLVEILKQGQYQPLAVEKQILIIYAGTNGLLDDLPVEQCRPFEESLSRFVENAHPGLLGEIREKKTLDDALKWAASHWPYDSERVRLVYDRCHSLMESEGKDFGERGEWLRLASDGGYPLAQVMAAKQQQIKGVSAGDDAAKDKESRRLASMAIRTRDPQVIWEIADSQLRSGAQGEADGDELAWFLAACQRGFDCSPQSDSVSAFCRYDPSCQPYESVADLFRRARGDDFPELEARARWINEKIDAGDWEALGF